MSEVIVSKAGGTSNAGPVAVEQSLGWAEQSDIFVASAPGKLADTGDLVTIESKVTDQLIAAHAASGSARENHIDDVTDRFAEIVDGLDDRSLTGRWVDAIPGRVRDAVAQGRDSASMLGERLQAEIFVSQGFILLDPAEAPHDLGNRPQDWQRWLSRVITEGRRYALIGNTTLENRRLRTFERGGSDISAGLAAYAIGADRHLNLTDHGAKSTDPKYLEGGLARPIPHMLYEEGRELGRNGTGLLHPAAMVPLMIADIPTEIRSTSDLNAKFTTVDNETAKAESRTGDAIALSLMENVALLRLHEPGMAEAVGRLAVFENALAREGIALIDSQGDGVDGQIYFVEDEKGDEASEILNQAAVSGGGIVDGRTVHFLTIVGYRLGTRLLDYTKHLVENWEMDIKKWQGEGHDFSHGRHSLRISLPSEAEAKSTLQRLHSSLIESPRRTPITWRDTGNGR